MRSRTEPIRLHFHAGFPTVHALYSAVQATCLPDPRLALSELVRVTRPGGQILIVEGDHETQVLDTPYPDVTRRFFHAIMWFITSGRKAG